MRTIEQMVFTECYCDVSTLVEDVLKLEYTAGIYDNDDMLTVPLKAEDYAEEFDNTPTQNKLIIRPEGIIEWQELFDARGISDPTPTEVLEFWSVSKWFADYLKKHGEVVNDDFHGLFIWCRTCSGQAIMMDSVIEDIYNEILKRETKFMEENHEHS